MVSERPAEVEDRAVPGHWEGDLITGTANKSAIGTLVERTTRLAMLLHLPDGHGAEQARDAMVKKMARLPELMLSSLTWDQGSELARHRKAGAAPGMQACFRNPRSPWRCGTNENANAPFASTSRRGPTRAHARRATSTPSPRGPTTGRGRRPGP